jgi:uncharacterized protein (DUF1499 family)
MFFLMALLPVCSSSPNCVSSEAKDTSHYIAPFRYQGEGRDALNRFKLIALSQPRVVLVKETPESLQFEASSKWMGFVDDVYCVLNEEEKEILVASLSRVGYYDFGVNRTRLEKWRLEFIEKDDASQ